MDIYDTSFGTIEEIKEANAEAGMFWFSEATVDSFEPKVESKIFFEEPSKDFPEGARLWVESTNYVDDHGGDTRCYNTVRFDVATSDIYWAYRNGKYKYETMAEATLALFALLSEKKIPPIRITSHHQEPVEDWHGKTRQSETDPGSSTEIVEDWHGKARSEG